MKTNVRIRTQDGYSLSGIFSTSRQSKGFLVINSALGVRQRYYARFCQYFNQQGFHTLTYDYRGIGDSAPATGLRGFQASLSDWAATDADAALRWSRKQAAGIPLIGIGHSFGGCCFGLTSRPEQLDGIILVAAQTGYFLDYPSPLRWKLMLSWYLRIPLVCRSRGYLPPHTIGIAEPLPKNVALEWARWCRTPQYLRGHLTHPSRDRYHRFRGPLLSVHSTDDLYAVPTTVQKMTNYYARASVRDQLCIAPKDAQEQQIGHFGFFQRRTGKVLWPRMLAWTKGAHRSGDRQAEWQRIRASQLSREAVLESEVVDAIE